MEKSLDFVSQKNGLRIYKSKEQVKLKFFSYKYTSGPLDWLLFGLSWLPRLQSWSTVGVYYTD